jgi:hypothetical protein
MNWRDMLFRRRPPIADVKVLADFIDRHAAFLVQKGIYEYSRARAGHYAKVLFAEEGFSRALERSRWSVFPLGLAMVGEVVEGALRPHADDPTFQLERLTQLVLSIFDRYPVPPSLSPEVWRDSRAELARRLQLLSLHPPKRVKDIPQPYAEAYWDLMPIKKEIRSADFPTTRSYLMITLCNIHDELVKRLDKPALIASLLSAGNEESVPSLRGVQGTNAHR